MIGVLTWLLGTAAAGAAYHLGHLSWMACGLLSVLSFGVGVAINQRDFEGE